MIFFLLLTGISAQLSADISFDTKQESDKNVSAFIKSNEISSWKNSLSVKNSSGKATGEISITINLDPRKSLAGLFDKATAAFNQLYSLRINNESIFSAIKLENLNGLAIKASLYFENSDFNIKMLHTNNQILTFLINTKKNDDSKLQRFSLT